MFATVFNSIITFGTLVTLSQLEHETTFHETHYLLTNEYKETSQMYATAWVPNGGAISSRIEPNLSVVSCRFFTNEHQFH